MDRYHRAVRLHFLLKTRIEVAERLSAAARQYENKS